jgi:rhodanese-related sulfurtransferase
MNDLQRDNKVTITAKLYPAMREAFILGIIAVIVAVLFNALRPVGIPLFGFSPGIIIKNQITNIPEIDLSTAHDLYSKNKVIFVDARDPLSFEEGHIPGAVNIYPDEAVLKAAQLKKTVSPDSVIITYCDGPQCPLSKQTAQALQSQGLPAVQVLVNGWSLWLNAGYPVARGKI